MQNKWLGMGANLHVWYWVLPGDAGAARTTLPATKDPILRLNRRNMDLTEPGPHGQGTTLTLYLPP
jgi:hypothetical protein